MEAGTGVADSELPELKRLAGELLAAESPEFGMLDQIASIAAGIAARGREASRRQLLDMVAEGARSIFPAVGDDLKSRFAQSTLDELSSLGRLLDEAATARRALADADADLMAARERGDYAAMAPLALAADSQKSAFANASGKLSGLLGLDGAGAAVAPAPPEVAAPPAADAAMDLTAADEPADHFAVADEAPPPPPSEPAVAAAAVGRAKGKASSGAAVEVLASVRSDLDLHGDSQPERRRIRDLIRQMRPLPGEAP